jgi:hypothetical protein
MQFGRKKFGSKWLWAIAALILGGTSTAALGFKFLGQSNDELPGAQSLKAAATNGGRAPRIVVDQLGYRPRDEKVAVIVAAQRGANADPSFVPGKTYDVRNTKTGAVVFSGPIAPWNGDKVHEQSGDRAWLFDFSAVQAPGTYQIVDRDKNERSLTFEIQPNVYQPALVAATRMYYYQRAGFAKVAPFAGQWPDGAAYLGPNQDSQARSVSAKNDPATARDLRGGWFDAGDTNKYSTFTGPVINQLLTAYETAPQAFTDRFNIPESGNGIPDIIDEVKWGVDWLKRMQDADGGVLIKVGVLDDNAAASPNQDRRPRYYGPKCSSATISTAAAFAHAARIYRQFPSLKAEAADLEKRAVRAWQWFSDRPRQTDCDTQEIKAGDADRPVEEQEGNAAAAAIHLFALTGNSDYSTRLYNYIRASQPWTDSVWGRYRAQENDAILLYTRLPKADPAIVKMIRDRFAGSVRDVRDGYGLRRDLDPYGAALPDPQYHWGSNQVQANYGNANWAVLRYAIEPARNNSFRNRAMAHLHYIHGVNPLGWMYLTNMSSLGAERSVSAMYHEWLGKGIYARAMPGKPGPPPGYLVGGPNRDYTGNNEALKKEPIQKRYLDSGEGWPVNTWELSEPAIYYQAAYIKLLAGAISDSSSSPNR